ncbi:MAG: serine hydrolase [Hyphomicrobiales bacterium]
MQQFHRRDVTLANWRQGPFNRWSFNNVRELIGTAAIACAPASTPLSRNASQGLSRIDGLDAWLDGTWTDAFLVLRNGAIAYDWYRTEEAASAPHVVFSVSKSITALLAGIAVGSGKLDPNLPVGAYVPVKDGTAYGTCSVRNVLDMTVSVSFVENYDNPDETFLAYREASGWNPVRDARSTEGLHEFLLRLQLGERPHGARFHYVSPNSDLLGWIVEVATGTRLAQYAGEKLFEPMGAAGPAYITVDRYGAARTAGGFCVTIQDLARIGDLVRLGGRIGDRQVVPKSWIEDLFAGGDRTQWEKGDMALFLPQGRYRSQWYAVGNGRDSILAVGIHGQWIYVDPPSGVVIAKQSSQPMPVDEAIDRKTIEMFSAIAEALE